MADQELNLILRLRDEATAQLKTVGQSVAGLGAAAIAAGAAATGMATELNSGLAEVATLIPGQKKRLNELRGDVQRLAVAYGTGTGGLTKGLYEGISAFGDTADTVKILDINVKAAKAGVAETGEALALTSAVTKGYNDTTAEAVQKAADLAFKTVELGQTNFPDLARSIGAVTPMSAALAVSQEELFGVMATATGVTGGAAEVSTQLRAALSAMAAPTASMTKLYADMGVESGKALIEQEGLQGAFHKIIEVSGGMEGELSKYIGSVEGASLVTALATTQSENWATKTEAMTDAAGAVDVAFGEMTQGVNASQFALDQHKQRFAVWAQNAGQAIIDFSGSARHRPARGGRVRRGSVADGSATHGGGAVPERWEDRHHGLHGRPEGHEPRDAGQPHRARRDGAIGPLRWDRTSGVEGRDRLGFLGGAWDKHQDVPCLRPRLSPLEPLMGLVRWVEADEVELTCPTNWPATR